MCKNFFRPSQGLFTKQKKTNPSVNRGVHCIYMHVHVITHADQYRKAAEYEYLRILRVGCEMKQSGAFFVDGSVDRLAGALL